jgi:hypothetical protein
LVSTHFAEQLIALLIEEGCLEMINGQEMISVLKIRQMLEDGTLDIELFN